MILRCVFALHVLGLFWNIVDMAPVESAPNPTIVLVLDVSESMESQSRINKLEDALRKWIEFDVSDGIRLGMVQFSSTAKLLSDLVPISKENRQQLVQLIPRFAQGETCVGCGLRLALQLLESTESRGMVILVTDVEDSEPGQDVKDMFDQVKEARVKVVTIAIGNGAKLNDIEQLAELTDGLVFSVSDEEGVDEILGALRGALTVVQKDLVTPGNVTYEQSPMSSEPVYVGTDIDPETTRTVETFSHDVTTSLTMGEKVDIPTDLPPSEPFSSILLLVVGIAVGVIVAAIILVVLIMCLKPRYRITRLHGKYLLAKVGEDQRF